MGIFSVYEINDYISRVFEGDEILSDVSVRGEISNYTFHSAKGHIYFTLKDEDAVLDCAYFSYYNRNSKLQLENGMKIVARGNIEVYAPRGKYTLKVRSVQDAGSGDIAVKLRQLKESFEARGMFDEKHKKPLPKYPKTIGMVTSASGAAIWDAIETAKELNPYISIILYPAIVEGEGAKESISRGIDILDRYGVDIIVIGRGGGSMEQLWAFNEEMVAEAIYQCSTPIISAVGHATDFLVADLIADKRVITPTKAMVEAVPKLADTDERIQSYRKDFTVHMQNVIHQNRIRLERLRNRLEQNSPKTRLAEYKRRSAKYFELLNQNINGRINKSYLKFYFYLERIRDVDIVAKPRHRLELYTESLRRVRITDEARHQLKLYVERMKQANPLERLSQGLAYVSDENDRRISTIAELNKGQVMHVRLKDGKVKTKVEEIISIKEEV